MGLRGPGASGRKAAAETNKKRKYKRRLPWKAKGLNRADRVIKFLQWLPVTKGIKAGKRVRLLPSQKAFIRRVYTEDKANPVTLAIKSEPKGNGKTGLAAGLGLCHLLGPEAEPRGEAYSAAVDRDQAAILFQEMEAIITAVPEFHERCNIVTHSKTIQVLWGDGSGSRYVSMSSDARKAHGLSPTFWVFDELAQVKTRTLLQNLMEGAGKRDRSLGLIISTQAEDDEHILSQLIDDAAASADPSTVVDVMCADIDVTDPEQEVRAFDMPTIKACNPALGVFLNAAEIRKNADRARRLPAFRNAFYNLRLNLRVDSSVDSLLFPREEWKAGEMPFDVSELYGQRCFGGLDLSAKHDLTAFVLAFPDAAKDASYKVLSYFWTPLGQMSKRTAKEQEAFKRWIDAGLIEGIPGKVIRESVILERLAALASTFDIEAIGFDRWGIERLKQEMEDDGIELPLVPFGQGFKDMTPAVTYLSELVLDARLQHGGNQVLTSCVANAIIISDAADGRKFDKARSNTRATVRIDGAVALAMAVGTAKRVLDEDAPRGTYLENPSAELALV